MRLPSTFAPHAMRMLLPAVVAVAGSFGSQAAHSVEFSAPVGVQEIGQHLDLKSTVSGIPQGAESQLRSTCLRARAIPTELSAQTEFNSLGQDVAVTFSPTIRQGGLLELKSLTPVNAALVDLELVSECPLVVFKTRWSLIMAQANSEQMLPKGGAARNAAGAMFSLSDSRLLASSRQAPVRRVSAYDDGAKSIEPEKPINQGTEAAVQAPVAVNEVVPSEAASVSDEPVKVASLNTQLLDAGLIESRRDTSQQGLGIPGGVEAQQDSLTAKLPIIFAALAGLGCLVFFGFVGHRWLSGRDTVRSALRNGQANKVYQEPVMEKTAPAVQRDNLSGFNHAEDEVSGDSHRVLESLIGSEEMVFDGGLDLAASKASEPLNRSALQVSLDLVNRADVRSWSLPEAYRDLVASRNKSLELHATQEALLLRAHIGLVELAFQNARAGEEVQPDVCKSLLEEVLGEHFGQLVSNPALVVPDLLQSYVRAKLCEVVGAEQRQLLKDNLISLNIHIQHPSLCFGSTAWREFLTEEGLPE